jgi:hypothetical protein
MFLLHQLRFDDGRIISLFMQALVISTIIGLLIFYFMYKLIEFPIIRLNSELDIAMREKRDSTEVEIIFPAFQALVGNINSLLTRYIHGVKEDQSSGYINKEGEAENLVQMVGYPAIALAQDGRVISCSGSFAQLVHLDISSLQNHYCSVIPDAAVQQNIEGLVVKSRENPVTIHTDQLEFNGHPCVLSCHAMRSKANEIDYFLITVSPDEGAS